MKKNLVISVIVSAALLGCGKSAADTYDTEMTAFINHVSETAASMDAIDAFSPEAADTALAKLSDLSAAFHDAAALKIPEGYEDCAAPMSNAATYMTKAYETYASACSGEVFDAEAAGIAIGYYESSMESLARLGELLSTSSTD